MNDEHFKWFVAIPWIPSFTSLLQKKQAKKHVVWVDLKDCLKEDEEGLCGGRDVVFGYGSSVSPLWALRKQLSLCLFEADMFAVSSPFPSASQASTPSPKNILHIFLAPSASVTLTSVPFQENCSFSSLDFLPIARMTACVIIQI